MKVRGKRAVTVFGAGAVAVVVVSFALGRQRLEELWHIQRLRSADRETRARAALLLAERGSTRAVPALLEAIRQDAEEEVRKWVRFGSRGGIGPTHMTEGVDATALIYALAQLSETARPLIEACLREETEKLPGMGEIDLRLISILQDVLKHGSQIRLMVLKPSTG